MQLSTLFRLILIFTLGPFQPWPIYASDQCSQYASSDPDIYELCSNCSSATDKVWNDNIRMCVTSAEGQAARDGAENCLYTEATDPATCFERQTALLMGEEGQSQQLVSTKTNMGALGIVSGMGTLGLGIANLVLTKKLNENLEAGCPHPSNILLVAAGAAGLIGDIAAPLYLAIKSGQNNNAYTDYISDQKEMAGVTGTASSEESGLDQINWDSQSVAFDYMIAQSQAKEKSLIIKSTAHSLAAGLAAAGAIAGIVELSKGYYTGDQSICPGSLKANTSENFFPKMMSILPVIAMGGGLVTTLTSTLKQKSDTEDSTGSPFPTSYRWDSRPDLTAMLSASDLTSYIMNLQEQRAMWEPMPTSYQSPKITDFIEMKLLTAHLNPAFLKLKNMVIPEANAASALKLDISAAEKAINEWEKYCNTAPSEECTKALESNLQYQEALKTQQVVNTASWRIGLGFASAALSGIMAGISIDGAVQTKKQIEVLKTLKSKSLNAIANNCQNRDDASEPACYCYLSTGEINAERGNSEICNQFLHSFSFGEASEYSNTVLGNSAGCIDLQGDYDPMCECAETTNRLGQTACMSTSSPNVSMALGNADWFSTMSSSADSLNSGKTNSSTVDSSSLLNTAGRAAKQAKAMADTLDKNLTSAGKQALALNELGKKMLAATLIKAKTDAQNLTSAASINNLASTSIALPIKAQDALASVQKDLDKKIAYSNGSGSGRATASSNNLLFGYNNGNAIKGQVIGDVMNKDYAIKGDINKNPDVSIWETITHRYHQTGLKRLFE